MKNFFFTLFKIAITLGIIVFLFSRVDLAVMAQHLARANPWFLVFALALYFLAVMLGALKWQIVVRAQAMDASLARLLVYSLVGLFFGNLLPSNVGGDVVRAYGLARATGRTEAAAISVLVDRLMGLVAWLGAAAVMAVLATATLARGNEIEQIEVATAIVAALFIFASALMFSRRLSQPLLRFFEFGLLRRLRPIAHRIYDALQIYRHSYRALASNLVLSVAIVCVTTFVWYAVALALGLNVSIFYFFLFNPLLVFVLLIPISFNGLGPKEATAVFFFGLIGVPSEVALALSLIFHVIVVLTSLPGGVLWWRDRGLAPGTVAVNAE